MIRRIVATDETRSVRTATIDEWPVPAGNFPDQIDIDSSGTVWFSQTNDHWLTSLDPQLGVFTQHPTTGGTRPDGLVISSGDIAWTGLYGLPGGISRLGRREIATGSFTAITPPYAPANLAIPNVTLAGTIWITDHRQNRVSEYDPSTGSWPQSLVLPTPNSWPTAGEEDPATGDVYFTEYNSSRLARKPLAGPFVEIDAPPASGPAFLVHSSGKIYFTEWLQARLAAYEIATGVVTEYQFPVAGELAGPIDLLPGGLIAVGTRNVGYIMVFNPATETFAAHPVPTASPGLKDGLRSDAGGAIWFTESGSNKIAVLRLGGTAPVADFSGAPLSGVAPLSVTFSDLTTNAPTGWSWSFGDGGSAVGASPTHVYATPGTYAVTLTVSSDYGYDTEVKPSYITVFPPCPVSSGALAISAQRQAHDVILTWPPHPDCAWDVHRVTDPQLMLGSPPIASTTSPSYVDQAPPEPLVCYEVVPTDR